MSTTLPFALLKPVAGFRPQVLPTDIVAISSLSDAQLDSAFVNLTATSAICYDYETIGTDSWKPETRAVGLALAWLDHGDSWGQVQYIYLALENEYDCFRAAKFMQDLGVARRESGQHIVAHNSMFDEAITRMHLRRGGSYTPLGGNGLVSSHDTFVAYKALASEGWPSQEWGMKAAMIDLLGWETTNEAGIDEWLISHGYHSNGPDKIETDSPEEHLAKVRLWESVPKKTGGERPKCNPKKEFMGLVPAPILGDYAIQDAVSCLQLHCRVLWPVMEQFPELARFHSDTYLRLIHILIDQQYAGIRIDKSALERHGLDLQKQLAATDSVLQAHPAIMQLRAERHQANIDALIAREPKRHNAYTLGAEPTKYKKQSKKETNVGTPPQLSKSWLAWDAKRTAGPQVSKTWLAWQSAGMALEESDPPTIDLKALMVQRLVYGQSVLADDGTGLLRWEWGTEPEPDRGRPGTLWVTGRYGKVELDRTKAGKLPANGVVLLQLDDDVLRDNLIKLGDLGTELEFVEQYTSVLWEHPGTDGLTEGHTSQSHWRVHPGWIPYGALTGRLTGKGPSLHQLIKSLPFLATFVADPGTVWYEKDWSSLEVYVLAEACRDRGLLDLYGPDANPNHDRYLYSAAGYPGQLGEKVRQYYKISDPTPESTKLAKKECKNERALAKGVCIAEGTLIRVQNRGWVPIEKITIDDKVWDGVEWVQQQGAVHNGNRECIELGGVWLTPDHLVLESDIYDQTKEGRWEVCSRTDPSQCFQPKLPSASWSDVWGLVRSFFGSEAPR